MVGPKRREDCTMSRNGAFVWQCKSINMNQSNRKLFSTDGNPKHDHKRFIYQIEVEQWTCNYDILLASTTENNNNHLIFKTNNEWGRTVNAKQLILIDLCTSCSWNMQAQGVELCYGIDWRHWHCSQHSTNWKNEKIERKTKTLKFTDFFCLFLSFHLIEVNWKHVLQLDAVEWIRWAVGCSFRLKRTTTASNLTASVEFHFNRSSLALHPNRRCVPLRGSVVAAAIE